MKQAAPSESLPYYKWYWRDWRGSRAVYKMTPLQRGLYRELLDEQWKVGAIRDDIEWLADAARCSIEEMTDAWPVLRSMFVDVGNGWLVNERMEVQRTEKDRQRVTNAQNGRLGGRSKQTVSGPEPNGKRTVSERHIAVAVAEQSKSSSRVTQAGASAALPLEGASASADEPASPEQFRAIMDALKGFGGSRG